MPIDCFVITFEPCNLARMEPGSGLDCYFRRLALISGARLPENDPDDARDLGGKSNGHLVDMHSHPRRIYPLTEPILGSVEMQHARSGAVDEQST